MCPCGLQYVMSGTAEKYSSPQWGCVIFPDFDTLLFLQSRWSGQKHMLCLTHVAQPVCGKREVRQTPRCSVAFLKLHTETRRHKSTKCNQF